MKIRRVFAMILALVTLTGLICQSALAAETIPIPVPDMYFGAPVREYNKDGKTCLEYDMPYLDSKAIIKYVNLLEEYFDLTLTNSYEIPAYGDYYLDLYHGKANGVMLYWDQSRERISVTIYDKVAYFVEIVDSSDGPVLVESPAAYFNMDMDYEYASEDGIHIYEADLGKNGIYALAKYIKELNEEYGIQLDAEKSTESDVIGVYKFNNAEGDYCMAIFAEKDGSHFYTSFFFDGKYCIPVD